VIPTSLTEIAASLHAVLTRGSGETLARGTATDSRLVREGDLFFALRGTTDGARFASEAHQRGAVATVANRPLDVPTLVVDDALEALQTLARRSLERHDAPTIVGITGSVGKTTTKDALAALLRANGRQVSATEGNLNNEIGLPLTVLAANERTEVLVLEMGATHAGDIEQLCSIAPPSVGVLTAVAPVHLESFGSLEALASAKGELAAALPEFVGSMVAPLGAPKAATAAVRKFAQRLTFAPEWASGADLWASEIGEREEGLSFLVHHGERTEEVRAPVFGTHLVRPLLAAMGGGLALGLDLAKVARGVSRMRRAGLRGEVYRLKGDIVVYDDSYNASPLAMEAVMRYGAQTARAGGRRLVAVLGSMFELGSGARAYHREVGEVAEEVGVDLLVCVGEEARWYAEVFTGEKILHDDAVSAADDIRGRLQDGDYVVVKGSRGIGLDALTRRLRDGMALV
jgi:UDP-N-acetylmuramoyl-tripeptide--D-alanyl-D-alanine ligase